jgi:fumarylacetoacetase
MAAVDSTHDPSLRSWVHSANDGRTDFPIQNLPLGVFRRRSPAAPSRIGVGIGDQILDLVSCRERGLLNGLSDAELDACSADTLNALAALGPSASNAVRRRASAILALGGSGPREEVLVAMDHAELLLPIAAGDYSDFYASVFHASNVGSMFRPESPLLPNYKHVPIAYHGRASSIVVSGTSIRRPSGQTKAASAPAPSFGPTERLDYELEMAAVIGVGNEMGRPVSIDRAETHLFGLCLMNDWSARDIQAWEYQPLGPFLGKSFATTIAPWIVSAEALAPFRSGAFARPAGDPQPLPYLRSAADESSGGFDVTVEAFLRTARMRDEKVEPHRLSRGSLRNLYWTVAQMIAHHTSNGCNLRPGDVLGTGTLSGPDDQSKGCLLEILRGGSHTIQLPTGETRGFLADGDEVIFRAYCERDGFARIGFGECSGVIIRSTR